MALLRIHKFSHVYEAENFLQGGIRLPLPYKGNEKIYGLHGLTLVFASPVATVTFADASGAGLYISEVIGQIRAVVALNALECQIRDGVLYMVHPTAAVSITAATSTAKALFGISANIVGKVFAPFTGAAPRLLNLVGTAQDNGILICTEE